MILKIIIILKLFRVFATRNLRCQIQMSLLQPSLVRTEHIFVPHHLAASYMTCKLQLIGVKVERKVYVIFIIKKKKKKRFRFPLFLFRFCSCSLFIVIFSCKELEGSCHLFTHFAFHLLSFSFLSFGLSFRS